MPFPMKIQPVDWIKEQEAATRTDFSKPLLRSRLRKLFGISSSESLTAAAAAAAAGDVQYGGGGVDSDLEPSSICLDKSVQNFIEGNDRPPPGNCRRSRCNCFHANSSTSDDEFDFLAGTLTPDSSPAISDDLLKSLGGCTSGAERNLLADIARIVEKNKQVKRKQEIRTTVVENLSSLGYQASLFTSRWERSSSSPAGVYEFIEARVGGERMIVDVDFRSEFEIARPTARYRAMLQSLPSIFVGKPERLRQMVAIVAEGVKQSLKKKGMPLPPWRKADYMYAKWLSCYRVQIPPPSPEKTPDEGGRGGGGEMGFLFGDGTPPSAAEVTLWRPPEIGERSCLGKETGAVVVTGLASLLKEKP